MTSTPIYDECKRRDVFRQASADGWFRVEGDGPPICIGGSDSTYEIEVALPRHRWLHTIVLTLFVVAIVSLAWAILTAGGAL